MPIPQEALVPEAKHADVRQVIFNRLNFGIEYWRPHKLRMDYWSLMYLLQDAMQQMKPMNYARYVSNQPRTALDLAHSIMTRNDAFWRIPLFDASDEDAEMRRVIGKVERSLQGMVTDLDESFIERGENRFWKDVTHQVLLRGMVAGKAHITADALEYRDSPLVGEVWDSRMVYPNFDAHGLNHITVQRRTTLGDLAASYPDVFYDQQERKDFNPFAPAMKVEYWSNNRPNRPGLTAVLAAAIPAGTDIAANWFGAVTGSEAEFCIPPYYHGYKPHELPVRVVMANPLKMEQKPLMGSLLEQRMLNNAELIELPNSASWWQGDYGNTAEKGRGLLSAVEDQVPQMNELIANVLHHFGLHTYGTWVSYTPDGMFPDFEPGIEGRVALTPDEKIQRIDVGPISPDAYRLITLLQSEIENGTLQNILRAGTTSSSGVLNQQMVNAALNTLEPYQDAVVNFGTQIGGSILGQLQVSDGVVGKFELQAPRASSRRRSSLFSVQFDPKEDLKIFDGRRLRPVPIFKPALPDDLATRIQAARFALDPRRPILSLTTVLEEILQVEDPTDEMDRIWEDMANMDPVLVLEQIAQALDRMNETDLSAAIRKNEFQAQFVKDLQFRQVSGQGMAPGPQGPGAMPPEAGGAAFNSQTSQDQTGGDGAAAAQGAGVLGALGQQMGV